MTIFSAVLQGVTAIWIASEIYLFARDRIQKRGRTGKDRGSRFFILLSTIGGIAVAAVVNRTAAFFFADGGTSWLSWVGVATMVAGVSIRMWAVRTLGGSFRTTVETHPGQHVCQEGPYRFVRHPAYSGVLLICIGFGVAVQNWLSLAVAVVPSVAAILYRIRVEERELASSLGTEYVQYQKRTRRLIPWIW
jgi:protein-S-isoprenylcysteine O-methyltransferase Ste14